MQKVSVKICGIKTKDALEAAISGGAAFAGFNFFRPSPRFIDFDQAAALARLVPRHIKTAAVTVDPDDALLDAILKSFRPDFIQLHGKETPKRVAEIKNRTGISIIKTLPISSADDFKAMEDFEPMANRFLFDSKTPDGAKLPGGNALAFDWRLMRGQSINKPWFLADGLNSKNVKEALELSGAAAVDVSSGVETALGEKSPALIRELLRAVSSGQGVANAHRP